MVLPFFLFWVGMQVHGNASLYPNQFAKSTHTGDSVERDPGGGGGTLGISRWGCAAGTLEPLAYTRASSAEFCYPILE